MKKSKVGFVGHHNPTRKGFQRKSNSNEINWKAFNSKHNANATQITKLYTMWPIKILQYHVIYNTYLPWFLNPKTIKIWIPLIKSGVYITYLSIHLKHLTSSSKCFWRYYLGILVFAMDWRQDPWSILPNLNEFQRRLLFTNLVNHALLIWWRCHNIEGFNGNCKKICATTMLSIRGGNKLHLDKPEHNSRLGFKIRVVEKNWMKILIL